MSSAPLSYNLIKYENIFIFCFSVGSVTIRTDLIRILKTRIHITPYKVHFCAQHVTTSDKIVAFVRCVDMCPYAEGILLLVYIGHATNIFAIVVAVVAVVVVCNLVRKCSSSPSSRAKSRRRFCFDKMLKGPIHMPFIVCKWNIKCFNIHIHTAAN